MKLRIVSWNINGLKRVITIFGSLERFLRVLNADIVCLQETQLRDGLEPELAVAPGWDSYFGFTRCRSGYSGTATFVRRDGPLPPLSAEDGFTGLWEAQRRRREEAKCRQRRRDQKREQMQDEQERDPRAEGALGAAEQGTAAAGTHATATEGQQLRPTKRQCTSVPGHEPLPSAPAQPAPLQVLQPRPTHIAHAPEGGADDAADADLHARWRTAGLGPGQLRALDGEGRVVITDHGALVLVNVYGPYVGVKRTEERMRYKIAFYRALQHRLDGFLAAGRRLVVLGDFNIAPERRDDSDGDIADVQGKQLRGRSPFVPAAAPGVPGASPLAASRGTVLLPLPSPQPQQLHPAAKRQRFQPEPASASAAPGAGPCSRAGGAEAAGKVCGRGVCGLAEMLFGEAAVPPAGTCGLVVDVEAAGRAALGPARSAAWEAASAAELPAFVDVYRNFHTSTGRESCATCCGARIDLILVADGASYAGLPQLAAVAAGEAVVLKGGGASCGAGGGIDGFTLPAVQLRRYTCPAWVVGTGIMPGFVDTYSDHAPIYVDAGRRSASSSAVVGVVPARVEGPHATEAAAAVAAAAAGDGAGAPCAGIVAKLSAGSGPAAWRPHDAASQQHAWKAPDAKLWGCTKAHQASSAPAPPALEPVRALARTPPAARSPATAGISRTAARSAAGWQPPRRLQCMPADGMLPECAAQPAGATTAAAPLAASRLVAALAAAASEPEARIGAAAAAAAGLGGTARWGAAGQLLHAQRRDSRLGYRNTYKLAPSFSGSPGPATGPSLVLCIVDRAVLCGPCDIKIHSANPGNMIATAAAVPDTASESGTNNGSGAVTGATPHAAATEGAASAAGAAPELPSFWWPVGADAGLNGFGFGFPDDASKIQIHMSGVTPEASTLSGGGGAATGPGDALRRSSTVPDGADYSAAASPMALADASYLGAHGDDKDAVLDAMAFHEIKMEFEGGAEDSLGGGGGWGGLALPGGGFDFADLLTEEVAVGAAAGDETADPQRSEGSTAGVVPDLEAADPEAEAVARSAEVPRPASEFFQDLFPRSGADTTTASAAVKAEPVDAFGGFDTADMGMGASGYEAFAAELEAEDEDMAPQDDSDDEWRADSDDDAEARRRKKRVARYLEKKKNRRFGKTIRYAARKAYAEIRPRIKGRFARKDEIAAWKAANGGDDAIVPECLDIVL
eukprot:XP_001692899.1 predicted protein [Chlamydomonas reinhardtii]